MNWDAAFTPLAAQTAAPMNSEDLPPGAPGYSGGPLANPKPTPSPTPAPPSLTTLAAGGMNHAQLWMSGQSSAPQFQQKSFVRPANVSAGTRATIASKEPGLDPEQLKPFGWSSGFA